MIYTVLKSIHIIGFVAWFSGMFYLFRIYVYHRESLDKLEPDKTILSNQFSLMADRVYNIICLPAMCITWVAGTTMIVMNGLDWLLENHWLILKLILLLILSGFLTGTKGIKKGLDLNKKDWSPLQLRLLNEVPTLFLFSIVLLAVLKNMANFFYIFGAILILGFILYIATKQYRKYRLKKNN